MKIICKISDLLKELKEVNNNLEWLSQVKSNLMMKKKILCKLID